MGKSVLPGLLASLVVLSAPAWGNKTPEDVPLALASQAKGKLYYQALSEDCDAGGVQYAPRKIMIALSGSRDCQGVQWLIGFYKGERVYLEASKVFYQHEKLAELQRYRAEQVEESARNTSLDIEELYLETLVKEMRSKAKLGVAVLDWGITDESEYTRGTGFHFKVGNFGKKTIKYIWMDVQGLNPVRDPVNDGLGKRTKTVKAVGPIEPDTTAKYSFDYVWHTDLVEYFKVVGLRVQFMDGSIKKIPRPDDAEVSDSLLESLQSDS
jgi:hypothetical protein